MKKTSIRRITAAAAAAAGLLLLSLPCAAGSGRDRSSAGEDMIPISFMITGTGDSAAQYKKSLEEQLLADFPNLEITVEAYPDEQYYSTLNTKLSMGDGPDFFRVQANLAGPNAVRKLAPAGYLLPLEDLSVIQKVGTESTDPFTCDGHIYAMDTGTMTLCTFYNAVFFRELGLSEPRNWQEFLHVCETLKKAGITPIVTGNKDSYTMQFCLYQLAASQVYAQNPDFNEQLADGTAHFTDAGTWDEVLDKYLLLYKNGYVGENSLSIGNTEAIERFANGEAAMFFDADFVYYELTASLGEDGVGVFPLPSNDIGEPLYTVASKGGGLAIYAETSHPELCRQIYEKLHESAVDSTSSDTSSDADSPWQTFLALREAGQYINNCNQGWRGDVESVLEDGLSRKIGGASLSINYITSQMQKAYDNG